MIALENSNKHAFSGVGGKHTFGLSSLQNSQIRRVCDCQYEKLKQARNNFQSSASNSLMPLHVGEPSVLGTVILPSVTSLWVAAGLLHKFLTGGEVLAAFGTF